MGMRWLCKGVGTAAAHQLPRSVYISFSAIGFFSVICDESSKLSSAPLRVDGEASDDGGAWSHSTEKKLIWRRWRRLSLALPSNTLQTNYGLSLRQCPIGIDTFVRDLRTLY